MQSFTSLFDVQFDTKCPVGNCQLSSQGCQTALPASQNLILSTVSPYALYANQANPEGYNIKFCFNCEIQPTGLATLTPIHKTIDNLEVIASPLDCSKALIHVTPFSNHISINFVNDNKKFEVFKTYEDIFEHAKKEYCHV